MEPGTRRDGTGNKVAAMLMGMGLTLIAVELGDGGGGEFKIRRGLWRQGENFWGLPGGGVFGV